VAAPEHTIAVSALHELRYCEAVRTGVTWFFEALVAGLLLGCGARLAMRVLSWVAGTAAEFSTGGSVEIVVFGTLLGTPLALGLFLLRSWRGWTHPWVGLWVSLGIFATLAARPSPSARSALAASPVPGAVIFLVFGALFALFGLWIDARWRVRSRPPVKPDGRSRME
jgi:hypothetical protein